MSTTDIQPGLRHKRLRFQYSLGTLLILMLVLSILCKWFTASMQEATQQREAVDAIRRLGGDVAYDYEEDPRQPNPAPPGPAWLRNALGLDFFATVTFAQIGRDDALPHLKKLPHLRTLTLDGKDVTDGALAQLDELNQLRCLNLGGHRVTDAAMEHIERLDALEWLYIHPGTQMTDKGVGKLREAMPNCFIKK